MVCMKTVLDSWNISLIVSAGGAPVRSTVVWFATPLAVLLGAGGLANRSAQAQPTVSQTPAQRIIFMQVPAHDPHEGGSSEWAGMTGRLPNGSRIVRLDPSKPENAVRNLTTQFAAAGRPDVSFDGARILFIGRRGVQDPVSVFEMGIDGSGVREVVRPPGECLCAIYLSTIYSMDMERPEYQIAFCTVMNGVPAICTSRLNGSRLRRVTFTPDGAFDPFILQSGRILFASRRAGTLSPGGSHSGTALFTVNSDGTDVFAFPAPSEAGNVLGMPCELPDGTVVYVESERGDNLAGGRLMAARPGPELRHSTAGVGWTRWGGVLAEEDAGSYHSPSAMPQGPLLVSYRQRGGPYGLYTLDPLTGKRQGKVYEAREWNALDAMVVDARPEPAGRSSVVKDQETAGEMYCLDAYLHGLERDRDEGDHRIDRMRVWRSDLISAGNGSDPRPDDDLGRKHRVRDKLRCAFRRSTLRATYCGICKVGSG